jgi:predicted TIM-barrel fold metal-dependent hydrolase
MYRDTRVLDIHSHIRPPRAAYLFMNTLMSFNVKTPSPIAPGKHPDTPGMRDEDFKAAADSHAKYLDDRLIDAQIINPHPLNIHGWMEAHLFPSWIQYSNDMVYRTVQARPDKFAGACHLPQFADADDTANCVEEIDRCVLDYGFVAVYVTPDITGRRDSPSMNDRYWDPIYNRCQELDVPIIVHATDGLDPRYRDLPRMMFQLPFVTEQYLALCLLRQGDVFDRFPGLKIVVCHCGGALDRHIGDYAWLCRDRDLSANLFYDTCAYDLDFLATAIKQRGVSQFAFGSEAPGGGTNQRPGTDRTADDMVPMIGDDPVMSFLSDAEKIDIFHNTPAKLFPGLVDTLATNAAASGPMKAAAPERAGPVQSNPSGWRHGNT